MRFSRQDFRAENSYVLRDGYRLRLQLHRNQRAFPHDYYHGQLLGEGDRPLVGHRVHARIRVERDQVDRAEFNRGFEAKRIQAKTDDQGNFSLRGLPSELKVSIVADAIDDPTASAYRREP